MCYGCSLLSLFVCIGMCMCIGVGVAIVIGIGMCIGMLIGMWVGVGTRMFVCAIDMYWLGLMRALTVLLACARGTGMVLLYWRV